MMMSNIEKENEHVLFDTFNRKDSLFRLCAVGCKNKGKMIPCSKMGSLGKKKCVVRALVSNTVDRFVSTTNSLSISFNPN